MTPSIGGPTFAGTWLIQGRLDTAQRNALSAINPDESGSWNIRGRKDPVFIVQTKDNARDMDVFRWIADHRVTAPVSYYKEYLRKGNNQLAKALNLLG